MTGSNLRRQRVGRLEELAAQRQERARAGLMEADRRVDEVDRRREQALRGAANLADSGLPVRLRGHLAGVGARHLGRLAEEKIDHADDADRCRHELEEATTKVRSLERLARRLDEAERERISRREAAELQDLVAIRAAVADRHHRREGGSR